METFVIFGAKYLIALSIVLVAGYFLLVPRTVRINMFIFFLFTLPLTYILSLLAGSVFENPRPFVVGGFEPLIPHSPDNGFPSNHALLASAVAAGMFFFSKRISLWLWTIAIVVAGSRILAGVHHTLDVLASAFISVLVAFIVHFFLKKYQDVIIRKITKNYGR